MTELARQPPFMTNDMAPAARARSIAGLTAFIILLAILVFVVETLSQVGVQQPILRWMVIAFALLVPALAAISTRTVSPTEFGVADRQIALAANAMAGTVGLFGAVFAVGLAAALFRGEAEMSTLALGLCGGCLVGGVLFAPYLRRGASQSLGDFLARRFGGRVISGLVGIIVAAALLPMLVAELSVAGMVGGWTLGIGKSGSISMVVVLMLVPPLLGGMRGVTVAGILQFVLVLAALGLASVWTSQSATGHLLPVTGYVAAVANLKAIGISDGISAASKSPWSLAGLGLCVTLGIAAFPTLLIRSTAARSAQSSRASLAWTLLFVTLLTAASVSMAASTRWIIEASPGQAGSIAELISQPWVVDWVARDETLVLLCGQPASEAGSACTAGPLKPGDLSIDPNIALLAASEIAGLSPVIATLTAVACLVAAIGSGSLVLFGIARALGYDLYSRAIAPHSPTSRRLLAQRLALLVAAGLAVHAANDPPADYLQLALTSLSLAASGLFPALLVGVWWRRANRFGAIAGMLAGFAIAAYIAAAELYDPRLFVWMEPIGLLDLARSLGAARAALAAVPVGLLIAVLLSLITPAPKPAERAFADALLVPRDMAPDPD
jgi:cation/acetate symporter